MRTREFGWMLACAGLLASGPACTDEGDTDSGASGSETQAPTGDGDGDASGDGDGDPSGDGDGDGDASGDGDGDPGGDGDGDGMLEEGQCRMHGDCSDPEVCFAPGEPNCGACMDGVDACLADDECDGPDQVCGFAEPGCYCNGTPRACVEDCNLGGCEAHETCGDDGVCTRDACVVDGDCADMPGYCVKGRCYELPGMCEFLAP